MDFIIRGTVGSQSTNNVENHFSLGGKDLKWISDIGGDKDMKQEAQEEPLAIYNVEGAIHTDDRAIHTNERSPIHTERVLTPQPPARTHTPPATPRAGKPPINRWGADKPPLSYASLIALVLNDLPDGRGTLNDLYDHVTDHFPFYANLKSSQWRNSIRYNLSIHPEFLRIKQDNGRGGLWTMKPGIDKSALIRVKGKGKTPQVAPTLSNRAVNSRGTMTAADVFPELSSVQTPSPLKRQPKLESFTFIDTQFNSHNDPTQDDHRSKESSINFKKQNVRRRRDKEGEKLKCNQCSHETYYKRCLKKHISRVHEKLRDYGCPDCEYATSEQFSLNRHIKIMHEKIKDHICGKCGYATGEKARLKQHIKVVHEKIRNHKCGECKFAASGKRGLRRHLERVHWTSGDISVGSVKLEINNPND